MIAADGLLVCRGGRVLLDLDRIALEPGRVLGVLGPNGAGKSTLLRLLAGELAPDAGRVTLDGVALAQWRPAALARRRAVLPQASRLSVPLRAEEVVALGRIPHGGGESEADRAAVRAAMAEAGVGAFAGRWLDTLSGGEQQRVHLARVFAQIAGTPPERTTLLLDEPTAALDWPQQHALLAAARRRAFAGAAVMVVLHDMAHAARYCDRILLLSSGRRVAEGPPASALTEEAIGRAYGHPVRRVVDPADGRSLFLPL
jgi:iron complex transport system ATP-binding protein